jgi:hypothetical protein
VKTIVKQTITLETKRFDFDNEFAYIEIWSNAHLKDNYFAEKDALYPDGTIRKGEKKYFYSEFSGEDVAKKIKPINVLTFKGFDKLFYLDEIGEVYRIDGVAAADTESDLFT